MGNGPAQFDAAKTPTFVWVSLVLSVIGGVLGAAGSTFGFFASQKNAALELELKQLQRADAVHNAKIEIVKQIQGTNVGWIDALITYLLEPIEDKPDRFKKFREAVLEAMANKAEKQPAAVSLEQPIDDDTPTKFTYISRDIQSKFSGVERLKFSNELVALYPTFKTQVVDTLLSSLIKEKLPWSGDPYRNNLYVLFTLARIPGGWAGTAEQLRTIRALGGAFNNEPTFAKRLEEATKNYIQR